MTEAAGKRVVLELNPGEPISGRIHDAAGHADPFRGWLELATRLERLRDSEPPQLSDHDGATAGHPSPEA